jgi:hypothetical protein
MLLAPESHERLEEFFRFYERDKTLRLPVIHLYGGKFAKRLTRALNIQAITLSRIILVAPTLLRRDERGRLKVPARLLVHETAHVLQYRREGLAPFLFRYLWEYAKTLWGAGDLGATKRAAAYRAISFEVQAREAADAYATWLISRRCEDRKG